MQISLKVPIDDVFGFALRRNLILKEHLHAAPGSILGFATELAHAGCRQLPDARAFQREIQSGSRERWSARTENGGRAERSDHFVVAHVDNPNVSLLPRAILRHGQNDMRIDGGDTE